MTQARRRLTAAVVPAILAAGLVAGSASAHGPGHGSGSGGGKHDWKRSVVARGLDNPRGIDMAWYGPVVAEAGSGEVSRIGRKGARTVIGGLPTATSPAGEVTGPVNVAVDRSGRLRTLVGEGPRDVDERFSTVLGSGGARIVADIAAHQATDPDPYDAEGNPTQSNPYGIADLRNGRLLVTDAGNNDVLLVHRDGSVRTVAIIPPQLVSTSHVGNPNLPPQLPAEAVPTSVAVGPDGYWYVAELTGFPFTPGASRIWRIAPWARDAVCDADPRDGCRLYASGFTSVTGIEFGRDGSLYVVEIVKNGVLGLFSGTDTTGALIQVKHGKRTEIGKGTLNAPGDVAVARNGTVYVTNRSVMPDGQVVAFRR